MKNDADESAGHFHDFIRNHPDVIGKYVNELEEKVERSAEPVKKMVSPTPVKGFVLLTLESKSHYVSTRGIVFVGPHAAEDDKNDGAISWGDAKASNPKAMADVILISGEILEVDQTVAEVMELIAEDQRGY